MRSADQLPCVEAPGYGFKLGLNLYHTRESSVPWNEKGETANAFRNGTYGRLAFDIVHGRSKPILRFHVEGELLLARANGLRRQKEEK